MSSHIILFNVLNLIETKTEIKPYLFYVANWISGMFYMEQNNKSTAWLNDLFTALGFIVEFLPQTMIIGLKVRKKAWREVLYMEIMEFIVYRSMVSNVNASIKPKYLEFSKCYQIITRSKWWRMNCIQFAQDMADSNLYNDRVTVPKIRARWSLYKSSQ